jgi:hypothetical protein
MYPHIQHPTSSPHTEYGTFRIPDCTRNYNIVITAIYYYQFINNLEDLPQRDKQRYVTNHDNFTHSVIDDIILLSQMIKQTMDLNRAIKIARGSFVHCKDDEEQRQTYLIKEYENRSDLLYLITMNKSELIEEDGKRRQDLQQQIELENAQAYLENLKKSNKSSEVKGGK